MYYIQFGFFKYKFFYYIPRYMLYLDTSKYYVNIKTKAIDLKSEIERVAYLV